MSSHIPFDIQMQIIKTLPVKSLIRFQLVSKQWKSLIFSSNFIAGYTASHPQPPLLLLSYEVKWRVKYIFVVDDDIFPQNKFSPVFPSLVQRFGRCIWPTGSSDGLLCVIGHFQSRSYDTEKAVIWNPAIRKSIAVSIPDPVTHHFNTPLTHVVGFGVCPKTRDAMLVNIRYIHFGSNYMDIEDIDYIPDQVMVFKLSTGKWRIPSSNLYPRVPIAFKHDQVVVGQFIYWLANDELNRNVIMSFDMFTEEFTEIEFPDDLAESNLSISKLHESLIVFQHCVTNPTTNKLACDVWRMEDSDPKTFTKLFTIDYSESFFTRHIGFSNSGEPIAEVQRVAHSWFAFAVTRPMEDVLIWEETDGDICATSATSFTESLLLLDYDDGHIISCEE